MQSAVEEADLNISSILRANHVSSCSWKALGDVVGKEAHEYCPSPIRFSSCPKAALLAVCANQPSLTSRKMRCVHRNLSTCRARPASMPACRATSSTAIPSSSATGTMVKKPNSKATWRAARSLLEPIRLRIVVRWPTTSRRRSSSEATSLLRRAACSGVSGSSGEPGEKFGAGRFWEASSVLILAAWLTMSSARARMSVEKRASFLPLVTTPMVMPVC